MAITIIKGSRIPQRVNKKQRARLMNIQRQKVVNTLKKTYFAFEPQTMKHVTPVNLKLQAIGMTKGFAELLNETRIKWVVNCYILSREKNGKSKIQGFEILLDEPVRHCEISRATADLHWEYVEEFRESAQADNFITAAWIASNRELETTNETAFKIFEDFGAFELKADWEEKNENTDD